MPNKSTITDTCITDIQKELDAAVAKVEQYNKLITDSNELKKLASAKLVESAHRKLTDITNGLDSEVLSLSELIRATEEGYSIAANDLLGVEARLISAKNRELQGRLRSLD
jgi:hypothetical protein